MAKAFFPLDEELELLPGQLTPHLHEQLVRVSTWMPFPRAAREFEWFTHVPVQESLARRLTEAAGAAYVAHQTLEVTHLEKTQPVPPEGPALQLLSPDGAMVPLVGGEWAEVKTLVIGTVQPPVCEKGEMVVHTTDLSYFSRLTDAEEFGHLSLVEVQRRGVERAAQVCAVSDGALWEQGLIDLHRADAVRILDFAHAAEHVAQAGAVVHGEATPALHAWLDGQLHELKHGSPDTVLAALQQLHQIATARGLAQAQVIQGMLGLFTETAGADCVCGLSSARLPDWQRGGREWQQTGGGSAIEGGGHALGAWACESDVGLAQHRVQ